MTRTVRAGRSAAVAARDDEPVRAQLDDLERAVDGVAELAGSRPVAQASGVASGREEPDEPGAPLVVVVDGAGRRARPP